MTESVIEKTVEAKQEETMAPNQQAPNRRERTFTPAIDIYDSEESIVLLVNMPGVSEENIDITLEKNQLTVHGKVNFETPQGYKPVYSEYVAGDYKRTFSLSESVDRDKIEATLKHGVLRLVLAKVAEVKPRQIAVRTAK